MNKNSLRNLRMFLALLVLSAIVMTASNVSVFADSTLTVSQTVDNNRAAFKVRGAAAGNQSISILVMQKLTKSVVYVDQAVLANGEFTFMTLLPKGDYTGFVSSSSSDKVILQDFSIVKEEKIAGFKPLQTITVAKGAHVALPSSVIAIFDDGANREVGVQWADVPKTDTSGQYTITGTVNGSGQTVNLALIVGDAIPTPTPTPTATPTPMPTPTPTATPKPDRDRDSGSSAASTTTTTAAPASTETSTAAPTTTTGNSSAVTVTPKLDSSIATAKAEITAAAISTAFAKAPADNKGVKTVEITLSKIDGAKAYEPVMPASALTQEDKKQIIKVNTPVGSVELPGNMVKASLAAGGSTISVPIELVDKSTIADPKLREAIGERPIVELNLKVDGTVVSWENKDAPAKVSIKYTPKPDELKTIEHLVIWYIDGAGNAVKVPNAKYNAATETVTFRTTHFSKYAVAYEFKTFDDAGVYPWAQLPIEVLASKGIINGASESMFAPAEKITRADFLVLLVKTLGITADFNDNFSDIGKSDYYYEALGIAKKLGITNGAGNNTFNPKEYISRQDLMVLSARALKIAGAIAAQGSAEDIQQFSDKSAVASYAVEGIAAMVKEGIVSGNGDFLNPQVNATRAETAAIMYRIFNKL